MVDNARMIGEALKEIPCIGDGDTGYGNAVNVKRTVKGYAQVRLRLLGHVCLIRPHGNPKHTSRCHYMPFVLLNRPGSKAL